MSELQFFLQQNFFYNKGKTIIEALAMKSLDSLVPLLSRCHPDKSKFSSLPCVTINKDPGAYDFTIRGKNTFELSQGHSMVNIANMKFHTDFPLSGQQKLNRFLIKHIREKKTQGRRRD